MKFFKALPKEKQQILILVAILSLAAWGATFNFYILGNKDELAKKKAEAQKLAAQLEEAQSSVKSEVTNTEFREQLQEFTKTQEERMVEGDPFSWVVREISLLAEKHPVRVSNLSPGTLAAHPVKSQYQTYTTRMEVVGEFDQLGRFMSALENSFPTCALRSVTVGVADASTGECRISLELALLVNPNPQRSGASPTGEASHKKVAS
jgi:Tfp pilus assembly protein PilO